MELKDLCKVGLIRLLESYDRYIIDHDESFINWKPMNLFEFLDNKKTINLNSDQLISILNNYDKYIIENDNNFDDWVPVCINEFMNIDWIDYYE